MQQQRNQEEFDGTFSSPSDGPSYDFMSSSSRSSAMESDGPGGDLYDASSQRSVGLSFTSLRESERTWTMFTQLMENGGQLTPTSLPSDEPLSAPNVSSEPPPRTCASPAESIATSILYTHPHTSSAASSKHPDIPENDRGVHDQSLPFSRLPPDSSIHKGPKYRWISLSPLHRNVLKCSIAYFIASLFTFCPYFSGLISDLVSYGPGRQGPTPSGHMVATIAVYYNPAKTIGGMLEADVFCIFGLLYASIVCLSCMSLFWWLELQPGWEWLGDAIAIAWIGMSMSVVAWMKAWMGSPTFNTACSMMSIIIFVVLVKEGGLITLLQVSAIVVCGSVVSNFTCCMFWPQTATTNLEKNIAQTLGSFSTLLTRLTDTFLLENNSVPSNVTQDKLHKAIEDHQNSFTKLRKNLNESRNERLYTSWKDYEGVVDSMNRLAQHLNGLRSSTKLQHELTVGYIYQGHPHFSPRNLRDPDQRDETDDFGVKAAASIFKTLVDELSPPLKALKVACVYTLEKLHDAFEQMHANHQDDETTLKSQDFAQLIEAIDVALKHFNATSDRAILRAYRQDGVRESYRNLSGPIPYVKPGDKSAGPRPASMAQEHEIVFLVYFFIFTLEEFARELILLAECIERVYVQARRQSSPRFLLQSAVRLLSIRKAKRRQNYEQRISLRRSLSHIIPMNRRFQSSFPKIHPHAPDTIQTPSWNQLSRTGKFKKVLWTFGKALGQRKSKYAIKAGLATALLASPAFFDATRPLFIEYWGDWALISCFVVLSPTIGATNYLSIHRILGTIFGAAVAAGIFSVFPDRPIILSIFGLVFSMPCFYYALSRPQYASASRFVLLTYNLTCLYSYNLREKYVDVMDIALYRGMAVTVGVLWAAIISRLWLPSEARRELNKELGEFCLNLGWLYTRLVASNSLVFDNRGERESNSPCDSNRSLLIEDRGIILHESVKEFMSMELHLQIKLIEIQGLLAQAQHEPRLKGPFPVLLYRDVLTSLQAIMDKLHSVRCVMTREEWCTTVTRDFILPVNKERREMVGNVIVTLSILGSAFHLKAPLPPYLPPCETSRQRLVNAIRKLDVVRERNVKGSRQLLYFAYALTMKGVTEELEKLGRTLQSAFGVIGQTPKEFEALFAHQDSAA